MYNSPVSICSLTCSVMFYLLMFDSAVSDAFFLGLSQFALRVSFCLLLIICKEDMLTALDLFVVAVIKT